MLKRFRHWLTRRALRRHEAQAIARAPSDHDASLDLLVKMLCRFEGFRAKAYQCDGKVWTYGYGSTRRPSGQRVQPGDFITEANAKILLTEEAEAVMEHAIRLLEGHASVGAVAAVASLIYNVGPAAVERSRFLAAWKRGDLEAAEFEFCDFNKVNGKPVRGLTLRRKAEWKTLTGNIQT